MDSNLRHQIAWRTSSSLHYQVDPLLKFNLPHIINIAGFSCLQVHERGLGAVDPTKLEEILQPPSNKHESCNAELDSSVCRYVIVGQSTSPAESANCQLQREAEGEESNGEDATMPVAPSVSVGDTSGSVFDHVDCDDHDEDGEEEDNDDYPNGDIMAGPPDQMTVASSCCEHSSCDQEQQSASECASSCSGSPDLFCCGSPAPLPEGTPAAAVSLLHNDTVIPKMSATVEQENDLPELPFDSLAYNEEMDDFAVHVINDLCLNYQPSHPIPTLLSPIPEENSEIGSVCSLQSPVRNLYVADGPVLEVHEKPVTL